VLTGMGFSCLRCVSIHAPAKGRHSTDQQSSGGKRFQSTPPRRGDAVHFAWVDCDGSFNPRPREGATERYFWDQEAVRVSIHAPAKGRRHGLEEGTRRYWVSIHAPAKGRPSHGGCARSQTLCFNPRPREGATSSLLLFGFGCLVSIHAPAKGRPRWPGPASGPNSSFNPRPREGATEICTRSCPTGVVSIHAPAKGRRHGSGMATARCEFQSTPPRRGDGWHLVRHHAELLFQSTPPRRGDRAS